MKKGNIYTTFGVDGVHISRGKFEVEYEKVADGVEIANNVADEILRKVCDDPDDFIGFGMDVLVEVELQDDGTLLANNIVKTTYDDGFDGLLETL